MNSEEPGESGLDLYDDILLEDLKCKQESLHEVQIKYQEALRRIAVLEEMTRQNETDIVTLKKKNTYLMKNISVLYKTACTELERKKDVIKSLRDQLASGFKYEYGGNCRNRTAPYSYDNNMSTEESPAPYRTSAWRAQDPYSQYKDSHTFYSSHSSNYPKNAIAASNTDTHHSTQASKSSYSSSNISNLERSEKYTSQSKSQSHTAHVTESTPTDSHTPPVWNTDSHNNARDSSSHASHSRYSDKHTPHTKQTDSSMSHSKHSSSNLSSRRRSESRSSHSRRPRSKTPTSSHGDNRSSSSKRSHSNSRKHQTHRSVSHTSEPHSSQSRPSESKKSARSSRISSKDRETSSSSRSRQQRSRSTERGGTKPAKSSHRSTSSDKCQDSQSNKQELKVEKDSVRDENSAILKRKLLKEFSLSCESKSKSKRKHREKSKCPEESPRQSPEVELVLKSEVGEVDNTYNDEEEENLGAESSDKCQDSQSNKQELKVEKDSVWDENSAILKRKLPKEFSLSCESKSKSKRKHREKSKCPEESPRQSPEVELVLKSEVGEVDNTYNDEEENLGAESSNHKDPSLQETDSQIKIERNTKDADIDVLRDNSVHASPTLTDEELEIKEDLPVEMVGSPSSARPDDMTPEAVTESQSLESLINEAEDPTISAQRSASSTSENSSHESDIADTECDAEKDLDKCEELDIEIHETCTSILWASKNLSDTDENGVEDGTASEVDKLDSASDDQKDNQSDPSSDNSDDKSDSSSDVKKRSIVIQCFGDAEDDSRSPIIIPCYKKSKSSSSVSDSDEDCDSEAHVTSTPSKSLISRSLFPVNKTSVSDIGESCMTLEDKTDISVLDTSVNSTNKDKESIQEQSSDEINLSEASAMCNQIEPDDNLDFKCSPILMKDLTVGGSSTGGLQNGDIKIPTSSQDDDPRKSSSDIDDDDDDNNNENCFHYITPIKSLDKNDTCSEDELEEGEVLTDEENESEAATAAAAAATAKTTVRSPVRYKSFSPIECKKSSASNSYREDSQKRPPREPMKSNPHNRQRVSPNRFVSKTHCSSSVGKHSRYRDSRSSQNRMHSSGSGSRSQSRRQDGHYRQSGFHNERSSSSSSSANRKRTY